MSTLKYEYSSIPELREDQDYLYIEKTILSVLKEQKVSFKQAKEIFAAIEARLTQKVENILINDININEFVEQGVTIQGGNITIPEGMIL